MFKCQWDPFWTTIVYYILLVITVRFDNAVYNIDEDVGIVRPLLILSNPSSHTETVQVISTDITAKGIPNSKYYWIKAS